MTTPALDMILDQVNARDEVIGTVRRRDVFAVGANFRVVHLLLFNRRGELLVQKVAPGRRHSGMWGSSVAGYLRTGENRAGAAKRKLRQELGVSTARIRWMGKTQLRDDQSTKFIHVGTCRHDGPLRMDPQHASGLEFLPVPMLIELRNSEARPFTPTFLHVLDFYIHHAGR